MVAPSFTSMTVMSEVYTKNNKTYIDVKNEKTGTVRSVRWYTDAEYKRLYGKSTTPSQAPLIKPAGIKNLEVTGGNPTLVRGTLTGDRKSRYVRLWQAYGAYCLDQKGKTLA